MSAARTGGSPRAREEAAAIAARVGYPVLVRPSYVLGGRAMRVCYDDDEVRAAIAAVDGAVLVDRFLESAIELDVDALCDGDETYVAAVMEHVEEAGIHSGDSSCVLPAPSDADARSATLVRRLGPALGVVGLLNVQLAIAGGEVYVLEVNPRARERCRSRRRRPASTSSTPPAGSPPARRSRSSGCRPSGRRARVTT